MTLEQRVELLENKLDETLELLKYYVHIDQGLSNQDTDYLINKIIEIEELE